MKSEIILRQWNVFVKSLLTTKNAWDDLRKLIRSAGRDEIDNAPKFFATSASKGKFEISLPLFVSYFRTHGGLESMLIDIPEPAPRKPGRPKKEEAINEEIQ